MFTAAELASIDKRLRSGETPQQIADSLVDEYGRPMPLSTFRSRLLASGKRSRTVRFLEDIRPVQVARTEAATQAA